MTKSAHFRHIGGCLATTAMVAGIALIGSALPASAVVPDTGTQCVGGVCITVNGTGLMVNSATVSNQGVSAGIGKITNVGAQAFHNSTNQIGNGGSFTVTFNRSVNNDDQICGQIGDAAVACLLVHS